MNAALAWGIDDNGDWLVLRGLPSERLAYLKSLSPTQVARALSVFPSEVLTEVERPARLQATAGHYEVSETEVRFTPRHPFLAGTSYAMFVGDEALFIDRPEVGGPSSTTVVAVYPTATVLPRNALRFYVRFSAPMTYGLAARHVSLEEADTGEPILGAFSPMEPELWDTERRRLTVLLDPARLKQGLAPHREVGYPLTNGRPVTLAIGRGLLDASGRPLVADHRHRYDVGPDIRSHVDPSGWVLTPPAAGTEAPLVVHFGRALDRALLEGCLLVTNDGGLVTHGSGRVQEGEEAWTFTPSAPWKPGRYHLLVDPVLEDVAGNSVARVFDRDLGQPAHSPRASETVSIPFTVPPEI